MCDRHVLIFASPRVTVTLSHRTRNYLKSAKPPRHNKYDDLAKMEPSKKIVDVVVTSSAVFGEEYWLEWRWVIHDRKLNRNVERCECISCCYCGGLPA